MTQNAQYLGSGVWWVKPGLWTLVFEYIMLWLPDFAQVFLVLMIEFVNVSRWSVWMKQTESHLGLTFC